MTEIVKRTIREGLPHPRGATWDGTGTNFALFSANATKVEVCLFDSSGKQELQRIELPEFTDEIWHGYLPDVAPGQLYGLTVLGDELRAVVGEGEPGDDDRSIARYVIGHGFKTEMLPCPDRTGSFLAYDGDNLFLSQRYHQRILQLDPAGVVQRKIMAPRQICGMVIVNGCFLLMTTADRDEPDDFRVIRLDARKPEPEAVELARVPFMARSLAWDGTKFWTSSRKTNEIVAFAAIGV